MMELANQCFESVLSLQIEVVFTFMSGLMCLLTSFMSFRNIHIQHVRMVVISQGEYDMIALNCFLLVVAGLISILLSVLKASKKFPNLNFNKYLLLVVMTMFGNFLIAVILSNYKSQVIEGFNAGMTKQLNLSIHYRHLNTSLLSSPSSSSSSSSASLPGKDEVNKLILSWDFIQKKLSCCGVETYSDYMSLSGIRKPEKILPVSCCSNYYIKSLAKSPPLSSPSPPPPHHYNQCYLDARLEVISSLFLHTEGCHGKLSRWLVRLVNKMMSLIYISMFLQACTIAYMSVSGYRKLLKI